MKLDYFPPKGTRYDWHPPPLTHLPWSSRIELSGFPRNITMYVWRKDSGLYQGRAEFRDIKYKDHYKTTPQYKDPLKALLATEKLASKLLDEQNLPGWAEEALALGWRPPSSR